VQVRNRRELGVEAAAREARYQVFYAQAADYVVLAHHLDDQVETVFLNLLRGSGVRGLAGMPAVRVTHGPHLLRPLLDVPRTTLLDYARRRKLEWVEDESNRDPARPRNFLRHEILPRIETRFPGYREACLRASRHLAEASGLLDELGALDLQHALSDGRLDVAALAALSEARARNLLRVYLQSQGAPLPDTARLNEMLHQLLSAGSAARVAIRWRGFVLRRYRQRVWVELDRKPPPPGWQRVWRGESRLELPELSAVVEFLPASGEGVRLSALEGGQLVLRLRRGGERLRPDCRRPRRSLKNLLQEAGMPPWLRERLPLLCHDETVIAVPGLGVDCAWQAGEGEAGVVVRLLPLYT
jgi:tRNA(Ile)-lysidine synthase